MGTVPEGADAGLTFGFSVAREAGESDVDGCDAGLA